MPFLLLLPPPLGTTGWPWPTEATLRTTLLVLFLLSTKGKFSVVARIIKRRTIFRMRWNPIVVMGAVRMTKKTTNPALITARTLAADTGETVALSRSLLRRRIVKVL